MRKYRFEKYSNSHTTPTDWDGAGQPTSWRVAPPTEWVALRYTITTGAVVCKRFPSRRLRDEWVTSQHKQEQS